MPAAARLVVGAAVVRRGRVLAARRTTPPALAGGWELPGGKVEPGEPPSAAVVRELAEELGVEVEVTGWLPGQTTIRDGLVLRVAVARLVRGEPEPVDHDAVRWVGLDELHDLDWLEPDRPFLAEVARVLAHDASLPWVRAVVLDEEVAADLVRRLREDGYAAEAERERLAGEDDDEDHPWAVVTDAPAVAVEILVDDHDGWVEELEPGPTAPVAPVAAPPPPALPRAPRRRVGGGS